MDFRFVQKLIVFFVGNELSLGCETNTRILNSDFVERRYWNATSLDDAIVGFFSNCFQPSIII